MPVIEGVNLRRICFACHKLCAPLLKSLFNFLFKFDAQNLWIGNNCLRESVNQMIPAMIKTASAASIHFTVRCRSADFFRAAFARHAGH